MRTRKLDEWTPNPNTATGQREIRELIEWAVAVGLAKVAAPNNWSLRAPAGKGGWTFEQRLGILN